MKKIIEWHDQFETSVPAFKESHRTLANVLRTNPKISSYNDYNKLCDSIGVSKLTEESFNQLSNR